MLNAKNTLCRTLALGNSGITKLCPHGCPDSGPSVSAGDGRHRRKIIEGPESVLQCHLFSPPCLAIFNFILILKVNSFLDGFNPHRCILYNTNWLIFINCHWGIHTRKPRWCVGSDLWTPLFLNKVWMVGRCGSIRPACQVSGCASLAPIIGGPCISGRSSRPRTSMAPS
jgi:hypothetical protein